MNIQIFGQEELVQHIHNGGNIYSHCISITNPGFSLNKKDKSHQTPKLFKSKFKKVLKLKFWDAMNKESLHGLKLKRIANYQDAVKVINFIKNTEKESTGYTIHCWQGISRSTAVAFGILQYFCKDEIISSKELVKIRRNAMPLKILVEYFDTLLGSNLADFSKTIYKARINALRKEILEKNNADEDAEELEEI